MSEILTRDTSAERSAARWGSVSLERKPSHDLKRNKSPRVCHIYPRGSQVSRCGTRILPPGDINRHTREECIVNHQTCVVCASLYEQERGESWFR